MFEHLFSPASDQQSPASGVHKLQKGVIIGTGSVGMACAYSMLIQNTLDEMTLIDIDQRKLEGEVMDLLHGLPFVEPTAIKAGSLDRNDAQDADLVIITAGAKQRPGESRLDLVHRNVDLFKQMIPSLVEQCPGAILLVVSNPVDIMTYVSWKLSGLPSSRVLGSGTVLDTARFRYMLAQRLELDPRSIHAYIIGEHGDSEVPVWSKVNVAGVNLGDGKVNHHSDSQASQMLDEIFHQVKTAAYEIIERKGATSYAIGLGVTQIAQAILRNQNRVLTVSSLIHQQYGLNGVCLSLPAVVNRQGVTRVLNMPLTAEEERNLRTSGETLRGIIEQLHLE